VACRLATAMAVRKASSAGAGWRALDAMCDTRFGRIGAAGHIGEKVRRMRAHRRQIPARVAGGP
jgi:hypothetical protein